MSGSDQAPGSRVPREVEARIRTALAQIDGFDAAGARLAVMRHRLDRVTVRADDARSTVAVRSAIGVETDRAALERATIALAATADSGVAPRCLFSDPGDGVLVTTWAPGPAWTDEDLSNPARLAGLAGTLRAIHDVRVDLPPFDVVGHVAGYRVRAERPDAAADVALHDELRELQDLADRHLADRTLGALGHHDVTVGNIVGARPMLIDWEYAACSDPAFDLATVVALHGLGDGPRRALLDAYAGGRGGTEFDPEFFKECERLAWLLARVWTRLARLDDALDPRVREWTARVALDR